MQPCWGGKALCKKEVVIGWKDERFRKKGGISGRRTMFNITVVVRGDLTAKSDVPWEGLSKWSDPSTAFIADA